MRVRVGEVGRGAPVVMIRVLAKAQALRARHVFPEGIVEHVQGGVQVFRVFGVWRLLDAPVGDVPGVRVAERVRPGQRHEVRCTGAVALLEERYRVHHVGDALAVRRG